jgi:hypothetical protein
LNLGIGFLVQTGDRTAAENTLKQLDASIESVSNREVVTTSHSINGIPVTSWVGKKLSLSQLG